MIKTFSQIYESAQEWKEMLNMKYEDFVKELSDSASDPRIKPFLSGGLKDGKPMDEKIKFHHRTVKVSKLKPTQNEIDLDKSLMWQLSGKVPDQLREILDGSNITIKAPIVTLNGAFILDGHHRWSQVYAMNPEATMACYDIQLVVNPIDMLKIIQMSIAEDLGYIPTAKVDGKNMLKIPLKEIQNYVETNISNTTLGLLMSEGRIVDLDKELGGKYIVDSVVQMRKTSSPVKGAPSRNVMPQTDDTEEWDNQLQKGDINFKEPLELIENEINEMSKKDHHFKKIVKLYDEGGQVTRAKIGTAIRYNPKMTKVELEEELEEMDIDDIYDIEQKLGISESVVIVDMSGGKGNHKFITRKTMNSDLSLTDTKELAYCYDDMEEANSVIDKLHQAKKFTNLKAVDLKDKMLNESRKISDIAKDIQNDWQKVNFAARPYLDAMFDLSSTKDMYGMDSADSIVRYFLSNASSWKGDKAKEIKKELNTMLKESNTLLKFEEFLSNRKDA